MQDRLRQGRGLHARNTPHLSTATCYPARRLSSGYGRESPTQRRRLRTKHGSSGVSGPRCCAGRSTAEPHSTSWRAWTSMRHSAQVAYFVARHQHVSPVDTFSLRRVTRRKTCNCEPMLDPSPWFSALAPIKPRANPQTDPSSARTLSTPGWGSTPK
jgi:hypothetical protein